MKPFDIILFGATGFTGRLVAEAFQDSSADVRWAIAGRNTSKLEALQAHLAQRVEGSAPIPMVVADSHDRDSLDAMMAKTKVVCTTVGPYAKFGKDLVAAAVDAGVHTCDLTGEPQFVRAMIDAHHEKAKETGSRIVHCCGFDSIPSDIGTYLLQKTAIEADGTPVDEIEYVLWRAKGEFSGGTIASLTHVLEEASDKSVRRVLANPYSLCDEKGPDGREQSGVRYSEAGQVWTGPFMMAAVNEKVVRRSNALLGYRYGRQFRYGESMRTGAGIKGWAASAALAGALGAGTLGLALRPTRRLMMKALPAPGQGPSAEAIQKGHFTARLFGKRNGTVVHTVDVRGHQDPGYGATATMLSESALALALSDQLGEPGVTTPGAALGDALLARFADTDRIDLNVL